VLLTLPAFPFIVVLPFMLSRYLAGRRAMRFYIYICVSKYESSLSYGPKLQDRQKIIIMTLFLQIDILARVCRIYIYHSIRKGRK